MREPAFWWHPPGFGAALLAPLAAIYGGIAGRRMGRPGVKAGIPVLCVGNFTVGGAGKTPAAIAVAEILKAAGHRPIFLSRGYGGSLAGPVQIDTASHGASDVGDEPLLLARVAPTIVAGDRVAGAAAARAAGASVVVMDDGFQNPSIAKDLCIVVVDGRRGIGNGKVLPAGPLRAPLPAQLEAASALLIVGAGGDDMAAQAKARALPLFRGRLAPDPEALAGLRRRPLLAFAGIGDPDKFFATLAEAGLDVRARQAFPDHHRYRRLEAAELLARADREGLVPVTTEKDWVRLAGQDDLAALASIAKPLPVKLVVDEADAFRAMVSSVAR